VTPKAAAAARQGDVEHVHNRTAEPHVLAEQHGERAAEHVDLHLLTNETAPVRDRRRCTRAGAARLRLADSPLPHAHREPIGSGDGNELDVGATREARVVLETRTVGDNGDGRGIVDEQDQMRVADARGVTVILAPSTAVPSHGDAYRQVSAGSNVTAHVDPVSDHVSPRVAPNPT
jgi:hypothetical protein